MASPAEQEILTVAGREVAITNPRKVLFPQAGYTKLDLARYYLAVAEGALRGAGGRPNVLVRYPERHRRRVLLPEARAAVAARRGSRSSTLQFPSGRSAEEVVPRDAAALVWMANLACLELHPHPVRADDLDHPDELRVDLDPVPGVAVAADPRGRRASCRATLDDFGLVGWPKTSGSRGMHVYVRIERRWTFDEVRRAALALAREVERRAPALATSKWWKEERHGVFLDYNQNAKDRTIAERLLGAADAGRARLGAADLGRGRRLRAGRLHAGDDAGALRRASAIATPTWTVHAGLARRAARAVGAAGDAKGSATRRGRRTTGSRPGEPPRVAPSRRRDAEVIRWSRSGGRGTRRRARRPRALEGAPSRGRRAPASRPTCSSTRCAAGSAPGRGSASTCSTCRRSCVRRRRRSIPTSRSTTGAASRDAGRGRAEHLLELVRRRDLELVVAAVGRRLVRAPALEDRRMAEARRPACGRTSPRRRARCAAAPTTDPCRRSSGSGRPACGSCRLAAGLGPLAPRDAARARARAAAPARSPAARASPS